MAAGRGFWRDRGFELTRIRSEGSFRSREDLERVVRIEFPSELAETLIREHAGRTVDYGYVPFWRKR